MLYGYCTVFGSDDSIYLVLAPWRADYFRPIQLRWATRTTEGTHIYILTHCGLYIVCMQVQPVPVRVIVRLPYNRPEDSPSDSAPVSLRQNSESL